MKVDLDLSIEDAKALKGILDDRMEDYDDGSICSDMTKAEVGFLWLMQQRLEKAIKRGEENEAARKKRGEELSAQMEAALRKSRGW